MKKILFGLAISILLTLSGCGSEGKASDTFSNFDGSISNLAKKDKGTASIKIQNITEKNAKDISFNKYYEPDDDSIDDHEGYYFYQIHFDFGDNYYNTITSEIYLEGFEDMKDDKLSIDINKAYITNIGFAKVLYSDGIETISDRAVLTPSEIEELEYYLRSDLGTSSNEAYDARSMFVLNHIENAGAIAFRYDDLTPEGKKNIDYLDKEALGFFNPEKGNIEIEIADNKPTLSYDNKTFNLIEK